MQLAYANAQLPFVNSKHPVGSVLEPLFVLTDTVQHSESKVFLTVTNLFKPFHFARAFATFFVLFVAKHDNSAENAFITRKNIQHSKRMQFFKFISTIVAIIHPAR